MTGMSARERDVFAVVWNGRGQWVRRERLVSALYADDIDGGPDDPMRINNSLALTMGRIRERLRRTPYGIEGSRQGVYRLVRG